MLLQNLSWPACSRAVLRTPRRWSAFPRRRDDSVVVSTSENSCPRNGADGNRDITSTVTRARGLHPVARCDDDDVLQLAVIFLLGHAGRRSHVARAVQVLFDPWALSTFVAVDVLLLAPVLRDPRVSKNCCKAIGCSSVAMSPLLKKAKPTSTWL